VLAVTAVIVEKCVSISFSKFPTLYILQAGPPIHCGAQVNFPPTLSFDGPGCVNSALINALK